MTDMDALKKQVEYLTAQVERLTDIVAPTTDSAEINRLVMTLGADGAAKEINRRNRLRK